MAESEKKRSCCKILCYPVKMLKSFAAVPPRPTQDTLMYWYIPALGAASYSAFAVHVFNPNVLASTFPDLNHVVANSLLFNAHVGTGLYLYNRKHMASAPVVRRMMYTVYGAVLFNFGSIIMWALTKVIVPDCPWFKGILATASSVCMILAGKEYVNHIDRQIAAAK